VGKDPNPIGVGGLFHFALVQTGHLVQEIHVSRYLACEVSGTQY